jgi:hypothetical protein
MKKIKFLTIIATFLFISVFGTVTVFPQTTEFSYQGFLSDNSALANGNFDFEFRLFENQNGGIALAALPRPAVMVTNGVFSVVLDFGAFPAANRYLEIGVRPAGGGSFTTLAPRSKILSTPFSTNALNAANAVNSTNAVNAANANTATTANNALQLGGVNANLFVQTNDARLSDARNPLPNSLNYVQNRTTQQTAANFNISGNGTAGGTFSGNIVNAATQFNLGLNRILSNGGIATNLFAGINAGGANTTGFSNVFFGAGAGEQNTTGQFNAVFGVNTATTNTTGSKNTIIGTFADVGAGNLNNAAAIGYQAFVESSNSLVLGGVIGKNGAMSDTNIGIGTTTPGATLDIEGALLNNPPNIPNLRLTNFGRYSLIRGRSASGTRTAPAAVFNGIPLFVITADGYTGSAFTGLGQATIQFNAAENWTATANGTAIKFNTTPNGSTVEALRMTIDNNGFVAIGDFSPARKLDVDGIIRVGNTTGTIGCVEDRDGTVIAGTCSSDLRFKKNITSFGSVLNNFSKLRPVNYFWRADEFADQKFGTKQSYGLIAQEVETLFPELVSTDEKGFKAVNYSKLPLLTIQAVKELKADNDALKKQIEEQRKQFALQQRQIDELKNFVYRSQFRKTKKGGKR